MEIEWEKLGLDRGLRKALEGGRYAKLLAEKLDGRPPLLARRNLHWGLAAVARGRTFVNQLSARKPLAGARVLDFGCGDGGVAAAFALAGADVTALDADREREDYVQALSEDLEVKIDFVTDPSFGESLPAGCFDVIVCTDVIEHVGRFDLLASSHRRLLRPDGRLLLSVPNRFSLVNFMRDPHFSLAGVSVLPRAAGEFYAVKVRRRAGSYSLNRLLGWNEVHRIYGRAGFELECISESEFRRRLQNRELAGGWKKTAARIVPANAAVLLHRHAWAVSWIFIGAPATSP